MQPDQPRLPKRSLIGLNAANFFQAEMVGVILPVLNAFLKEANWRYDAIGFATAAGGLGTLLFQSPAGWLTDKITCRRTLFAVMALVTGACFVQLPFVPRTQTWVDSLLFVSGAAQTLFGPLLGALALALAGHRLLNRVVGANQSWNHAGNIAAALLAMAFVSATANPTSPIPRSSSPSAPAATAARPSTAPSPSPTSSPSPRRWRTCCSGEPSQ